MTALKIQGHDVEVKQDGVKIGCEFFPKKELENLLEEINNCPKQAFPNVSDIPRKDTLAVIEQVRDLLGYDFMGKSNGGDYKDKGFYLNHSNCKKWKVVVDSNKSQILILEEDEVK